MSFCTVHFVLAFALPCGIAYVGYSTGLAQLTAWSTRDGAIGFEGTVGCKLRQYLIEWSQVWVTIGAIHLYMLRAGCSQARFQLYVFLTMLINQSIHPYTGGSSLMGGGD